jgi:uncharacterized membrane protein YcaP (DUF421 family)
MQTLLHVLIGDWHYVVYAAIKALALFLTAAAALRLTERRTLAEFAPFDWATAVAVGAIIGRTATATDASWLVGAAALVTLLGAHAAVARLRFRPAFARLIDPPLRVLIRDGEINRANLRQCRMTEADLYAVLRRHGCTDVAQVHLAIFEAKGTVSVLKLPSRDPAP